MKVQTVDSRAVQNSSGWLKRYYLVRFAFSAAWVALAFTIAKNSPGIAAAMLVIYPTWDAVANFVDAQQNGGLRSNFSQIFNFVASLLTAAGIAYALTIGMKPVLMVFGVWAFLAGVSQLVTGVRRWKTYGAQWAMILSGGQSALVAGFFFKNAATVPTPGIEVIAPYAALGAFYFLVSGIWLVVSDARRSSRPTTA